MTWAVNYGSTSLALCTVFGAFGLIAQTAPPALPLQVDLCASCTRQEIRVPLTPATRASQTSGRPRLAEVRANGVPDSELISLFTLTSPDGAAPADRSAFHIVISDRRRLAKSGSYELIVETAPGGPKVTVVLRAPFAELKVDPLKIPRSTFALPFGFQTFSISEQSGKTTVTNLHAVTLDPALLGGTPVSGQVEFDFPVIPAGQGVQAKYRLKGSFPLGVVTGSSVFISPQLNRPLVVNWRVRSTLGLGWLLLYTIAGAVVSWLLPGGVEAGERARQARSLDDRKVALNRRDLQSNLGDILVSLNQPETPAAVAAVTGRLRALLDRIRDSKTQNQIDAVDASLDGVKTELRTAIVAWQQHMADVYGLLEKVPQLSTVVQQTKPMLDDVTAAWPIETSSDVARLVNASAIQLTRARAALSLLASALAQAREKVLAQIRDPHSVHIIERAFADLIDSLPRAADDPETALGGLEKPIQDFDSAMAKFPDFVVQLPPSAIIAQSAAPVVIRIIEPTPIRFPLRVPVRRSPFRITKGQSVAVVLVTAVVGAFHAAFIGTEYNFFQILFLMFAAVFAGNALLKRRTPEPVNESASSIETDPNVEIAELHMSLLREDSWGSPVPIPDRTALAQDTVYRLRFQIPRGNILGRLRDRAFGAPMLDVALQGKDLEVVRTPIVRSFSGAEPDSLEFKVRTPKEPTTAQLRLLVYYRNHLVQSFLLTADICESETSGPSAGFWEPKREFSSIDDLRSGSVRQLQPRLVSLALNSGRSGTHQLFLKGEGIEGDVPLDRSTFDGAVAEMRKVLDDATRDPKNRNSPRIYTPVTPGQPLSPTVQDTIRSLAQKGLALYNALFDRVSVDPDPNSKLARLRSALVTIQAKSDQRVQVVRLDFNCVFPWAALYDYDIPADKAGAPVCLGYTSNGAECGHKCDSDVYCVRGFWGVRHQVEECLDHLSPEFRIAQPSGIAPVRILADRTMRSSQVLETNLNSDLGPNKIECGPVNETEIVELLWKEPPYRPAVLIVLGHMEEADERIRLKDANQNPTDGFFSRPTLAKRNRKSKAPWGQPRPIVLLMACESGATSIKTVNNFVTALNTAGASAIVGTESVIDSVFAADCARDITTALLKNNKTLGEAITEFRRKSLQKGLPLAFVFNAIGNVDLKIQ